MTTTTRLLTLTAAAFAIGAAGLAVAQQGNEGPDTPRQGMRQGMGMGQHSEDQRGGHHQRHGHGAPSAAQVAQHLDKLKAELKITDAQLPAWQQFATTVKTEADSHEARRTAMRAQMQASRASGAAPDRQALRSQMQQQREASRNTHAQARQALYAVLTPEQKAVAEQKMRLRAGQEGGHGPRGGHRHNGA